MNEQYVREINGYKIKDEEAIRTYENVSSMKSDTKLTEGMYVKTKGYYNINDCGGAEYLIRVKTNSDTEDNGTIHFTQNNLVAELISNEIKVEYFGAKGDGVTDDTEAFTNAIEYLNDLDENKRVLYLSNGKNYILTDTLLIKNNFTLTNKSKLKASITNNTTDIFEIDSESSLNNRCYNIELSNIKFVGTNKLISDTTIQLWNLVIKNCNISGFENIFNLPIYATHIYNNVIYNIKSFGTISGSDNIIENNNITGLANSSDRKDSLFILNGLLLTRFLNNFLTGSLESEKGVYNIIKSQSCKDLTFECNWFDYCDRAGVFINESNFIDIINNTFRGNARITNGNDDAHIVLKGSSNVNINYNSFLNVHIGDQNLTANAYHVFDYSGYIANNVVIKDNKFQIPYYYKINLTNKSLTKGFIIEENSVYNYIDTNINLLQKYSVDNSNSNGIYYYQDNHDNVVCSGTSTANTSIYLNGSYGASTVLFTLRENKTYKAKINDIDSDIQLALFNGSTLIKIFSNNEDYTPNEDTEITAVAIFIQNNKTYYFAKTKPQLFLIN